MPFLVGFEFFQKKNKAVPRGRFISNQNKTELACFAVAAALPLRAAEPGARAKESRRLQCTVQLPASQPSGPSLS